MASTMTPAEPTTITDGHGSRVTLRQGHASQPLVRLAATDTNDGSVVLLDLTPEQAYTLGGALSTLAWDLGVGK